MPEPPTTETENGVACGEKHLETQQALESGTFAVLAEGDEK